MSKQTAYKLLMDAILLSSATTKEKLEIYDKLKEYILSTN